MIDFTNMEINNFKYYGGANGGKRCIKYQNEDYMLKFPSVKDNNDSYSNNCISEYITCHIIDSIGLNVQKTFLGKYTINGKEKIVVACKDFAQNGFVLKEFAELKNSQVESSNNGYGTELDEVIKTIEKQTIIDVKSLKEFFWNLFIVDALVGNFDRHNGNWGFLINEQTKEVKIAPIYDCASCLYPQLDDNKIKEIMDNEDEMQARVFVFPNSALKINDKKINYYDYISSLVNTDCNNALKRIFPNINLVEINKIIDDTLFINDIRKEFYKKILKMGYELILKDSYDKKIVRTNLTFYLKYAIIITIRGVKKNIKIIDSKIIPLESILFRGIKNG